jgi:hypothetical protein
LLARPQILGQAPQAFERLTAHVMLDALGVDRGNFVADADGAQEIEDDLMLAATFGRELAAGSLTTSPSRLSLPTTFVTVTWVTSNRRARSTMRHFPRSRWTCSIAST